MKISSIILFALISSCVLAQINNIDPKGKFLREKRDVELKKQIQALSFSTNSAKQLSSDMEYQETSKIELGKLNSVKDIAISSQGDQLVAGLQNTTTLVYQNKNIVASFEGDENNTAVAINDKYIAEARNKGQVRIFDRQTFENIYNTTDAYYNFYGVQSIEFSENGEYLIVATKSYMDIYELEPEIRFKQTKTQYGYAQITDLAFAKNSSILFSASRSTIVEYEINDEQIWSTERFLHITGNETKLVCSKDYLAASINNDIVLFDINNLDSNHTIENEQKIKGITFSSDESKLIVGTESNGVKIFNSGSWELLYTVKEDSSYINVAEQVNDNLIIGFTNGEDSYLSTFTLQSTGGGGDGSNALFIAVNVILSVISSLVLF